ncbi:MAG: M20 metallopeptidase family protein [Pyramidobacter sp.]|jgi:amidohydrolase
MVLKEKVKAIQTELVELRRHFHSHPELSWKEFDTQKKIVEYLEALDIPCVPASKTGVIATIKGARSSGTVIGIRADIDALPLSELNDVPYQSKNQGVMHACGHDAHIAILLGTAKVLASMRDELTVTVRLIFQPAEEFIADSGAYYMKTEPLVAECSRLIALHIWSKIPAGFASLRYGPVMSAADTFDIFVSGKGGHGALPHQTIDPVLAGSELVVALQGVISREVNPLEPAVISVTAFQSGTTSNVIPDGAHLQGTARTFSNELRDAYPQIIKRVASGVSQTTRAEISVDYHMGPPPMINDSQCVDTGRKACDRVFGSGKMVDWELQMGGEDFAKYTNPKCLLLLGGGFADEARRCPQHSPHFDIDENALALGVEYFVQYVLCYEEELEEARR